MFTHQLVKKTFEIALVEFTQTHKRCVCHPKLRRPVTNSLSSTSQRASFAPFSSRVSATCHRRSFGKAIRVGQPAIIEAAVSVPVSRRRQFGTVMSRQEMTKVGAQRATAPAQNGEPGPPKPSARLA